ncbi:hypothetical protein LTR53_013704 [Teratosphaeriaceae sp. CCFEE 6253]|nr:hypothetical protein LTR53_013704 [Teratosphaeriaceae sp. CCFEE 6253]
MALPTPILYIPSKHEPTLDQVAKIHADCVLQDGTLATFLPDEQGQMSHGKILNYWRRYHEEVEVGSRFIILQFLDDSEEQLMGYASLDMPPSETGPFRGSVQKLMVSPKYRYRGVARRVMGKLEEVAREQGRWMLVSLHSFRFLSVKLHLHINVLSGQVLDTTIGSGAESMYPRLGYIEIGTIPVSKVTPTKYGIHPHTRQLVDETFFYKDLR